MFSTPTTSEETTTREGIEKTEPLPQQTEPVAPQRLKESEQKKRRGGNDREYVRMNIPIIGPSSATPVSYQIR